VSFYRLNNQLARQAACRAVLDAPEGWICKVTQETRSLDQNALLWPLLTDISQQVEWYGRRLTQYEWKDVFSASLRKSKVVPGLDGGFVVLGQRTSVMPKHEFSELIDLIYAFGAEHGVKFEEKEAKNAQTA
jgi:hypothetical protein